MALIAKAKSIVSQMTDNPNFPTPTPTLASINTLIANLEEVQQLIDAGNYSQKELRDANKAALIEGLTLLGYYVEATSAGDAVKLASSGFELNKDYSNHGTPAQPEGVKAELTGVTGDAFLKWKPVPNAVCYLIEATTQNPASPESVWEQKGISTRARYTCTGLTPGQYYSFRVSAVGTGQGNKSAPSEPATSIIG